MKIYEGVYQRPGHPLDGARVRVVGEWRQETFHFPGGETRLVWVALGEFQPCKTRMNVTRGQLRPLRADERPAYIESPEQAFAPLIRRNLVEALTRTNEALADLPFVSAGGLNYMRYDTGKDLVGGRWIQPLSNNSKERDMKNRKHVDLMHSLQEDLQTVEAYFPENGQTSKGYTYKVPAGWEVRGGDQLVVDTPSGETKVVMVREVHVAPQLDGGYDYKWAVAKVDRAEHCQLVNRDAKFLDEMAEVERLNRRKATLQEAREKLGANTAARKRFDHAVKMLGGA